METKSLCPNLDKNLIVKIGKNEVKKFFTDNSNIRYQLITLPKAKKEFFIAYDEDVLVDEPEIVALIFKYYPTLFLSSDKFIDEPENFNCYKITLFPNQEIVIGIDEGIFISSYFEDIASVIATLTKNSSVKL
jgi:hypothetical protein